MLDDRASLDSSTTKGNDAEWLAVNFALSRSYGGVVLLPGTLCRRNVDPASFRIILLIFSKDSAKMTHKRM